MAQERKGFNWLERHIDGADSEVNRWPTWKSQGSTLEAQTHNKDVNRPQDQPESLVREPPK